MLIGTAKALNANAIKPTATLIYSGFIVFVGW